jgi:hypothetical protein
MRKKHHDLHSTNHTTTSGDKATACSHYMGRVLTHFTRKGKSSPKISYNIHFCVAIHKFPVQVKHAWNAHLGLIEGTSVAH